MLTQSGGCDILDGLSLGQRKEVLRKEGGSLPKKNFEKVKKAVDKKA